MLLQSSQPAKYNPDHFAAHSMQDDTRRSSEILDSKFQTTFFVANIAKQKQNALFYLNPLYSE